MSSFKIAGITDENVDKLIEVLQPLLTDVNDLHLILKHVHWNVTGPNFIGVHEMLDPQVDLVRGYADSIAERMSAFGGSPIGVPTRVSHPDWADYDLDRDLVSPHLYALDNVYNSVLSDFREAITATDELDSVTQDMLIEQTAGLEKFQWFIRAHLENAEGKLVY